ncbi:KTSC domain-containing protein [archaeon CG07_land_8_20_14_0_80_38_8]|nr:MAG: KTSC domain-containing protein [archaeon CG07_land_8_20_14_0_80_38_8]
MNRKNVTSSNIRSIGYDEQAKVLEVEFISGAVYQYTGVSLIIFNGLMNAGSHGTYFHNFIRDKFHNIRIK